MIIIGIVPLIIILLLLMRGSRASRRTNKLLSYQPEIAAGIARERKAKAIIFVILCAVLIYANRHAHAEPIGLAYWYHLDEQCRGGPGSQTEVDQACVKRLAIDKILEDQGCKFRYPDGWPGTNDYWKCPK